MVAAYFVDSHSDRCAYFVIGTEVFTEITSAVLKPVPSIIKFILDTVFVVAAAPPATPGAWWIQLVSVDKKLILY